MARSHMGSPPYTRTLIRILLCCFSACLCVAAASPSADSHSQSPLYSHAYAHSTEEQSQATSAVIKINEDTFKQMKSTENYIFFVQYYHPYSPTARAVEREWTDAANSLQGFLTLAVVDCAVEKSLCIAQNVNHAHPEIHFYKAGDAQAGGTIGIVYSQAKQAKAIVAFALLNLRNPSLLVDDSNFHSSRRSSLSTRSMTVTLFSNKKSTPSIFKSLATQLEDDIGFFEVRTNTPSEEVQQEYGIGGKYPTMVFQIGENGTKHVFVGDWSDIAAIRNWILRQAYAITRARTPNIKEYPVRTPSIFPSWVPHFGVYVQTTPAQTSEENKVPTAAATSATPAPAATPSSAPPHTTQPASVPASSASPSPSPSSTSFDGPLPELSDSSCYQLYCNSPHDSRTCIVLVLYPNMMSTDQMQQAKDLIKRIERKIGRSQHNFGQTTPTTTRPTTSIRNVSIEIWLDGTLHSSYLASSFDIHPSILPDIFIFDGHAHRFAQFLESSQTNENNRIGIQQNTIEAWIEQIAHKRVAFLQQTPLTSETGRHSYADLPSSTINCPPAARASMGASTGVGAPSSSSASSAPLTDGGQIVPLNSREFESLVLSSYQPWIILFCSDTESSCQTILASFINAARTMRNYVRFGVIDVIRDSELARTYDVTRVPSIQYFDQLTGLQRNPSTIRFYLDPTSQDSSQLESGLINLAHSLIDATRVTKVRSNTLEEWVRISAQDADVTEASAIATTPLDTSVVHVLLFNFATDAPSYLRALSHKYRTSVYFGTTTHAESRLVTRFGVTQVPSIYVFTVPRLTGGVDHEDDASSSNSDIDTFQPMRYDGTITFNHIAQFIDQFITTKRIETTSNVQPAPAAATTTTPTNTDIDATRQQQTNTASNTESPTATTQSTTRQGHDEL